MSQRVLRMPGALLAAGEMSGLSTGTCTCEDHVRRPTANSMLSSKGTNTVSAAQGEVGKGGRFVSVTCALNFALRRDTGYATCFRGQLASVEATSGDNGAGPHKLHTAGPTLNVSRHQLTSSSPAAPHLCKQRLCDSFSFQVAVDLWMSCEEVLPQELKVVAQLIVVVVDLRGQPVDQAPHCVRGEGTRTLSLTHTVTKVDTSVRTAGRMVRTCMAASERKWACSGRAGSETRYGRHGLLGLWKVSCIS